ncbi:hypothetical protein [Paenibacillus medicaginis]|uniref:GNAT family N-acetyltransferase n=1 Tax=Paenibacillus medicaginis TaxID=1470560 RepID=A0ABV5BVV7_9BACL
MADWWLEGPNGSLYKAFFLPVSSGDLSAMKWTRNIIWRNELDHPERNVFKLVDEKTEFINGAISLSDKGDHIFIHLIEAAPRNRYGVFPPRPYINVARLMMAFAGKVSFDYGYEGFLALTPKTKLLRYYIKKYNAFLLPGRNVGIDGTVTSRLIGLYYR